MEDDYLPSKASVAAVTARLRNHFNSVRATHLEDEDVVVYRMQTGGGEPRALTVTYEAFKFHAPADLDRSLVTAIAILADQPAVTIDVGAIS